MGRRMNRVRGWRREIYSNEFTLKVVYRPETVNQSYENWITTPSLRESQSRRLNTQVSQSREFLSKIMNC